MPRLHLWHEDLVLAERDHDYDPSWDYETVPPPPEGPVLKHLNDAMAQVERDVLPPLGIEDACVFTVDEGAMGDRVGVYVNGTSSCPFIGLDLEKIWREAGPEEFGREVLATLVHELGHAYLDESGIDEEAGDADYEDAVEEFAQHYLETGTVDLGPIDLQITAGAFRD